FADTVKIFLRKRVEDLDRSAILPLGSKTISSPSLRLEKEEIDRLVQELEELGQVKNVAALLHLQRVMIEQNDPCSGWFMVTGVVTEDPAKLNLPVCSSDLPEPTSVMFWSGYYRAFDNK
ncbi:hypothetical protein BaRGS_00038519, partial [Batillaria attramentaria]